MSFFEELKRRNVVKVGVLYIVASWLILQVGDVLFDALDLPSTWLRLVLALLILGFPLALIFSWVYELTPEGIKREKDIDRGQSITGQTGHKINVLIVILLAVAIAIVVADRLIPEGTPGAESRVADEPAEPGRSEQADPTAVAAAKFAPTPDRSIAVLPFVNMSGDEENEYFSDGLSEEILNFLARVPDLRVTARTSSFQFKDKTADLREVGAALNVAHLLEGSVRRSGNRARITAQLIRTSDGYHLWSETYDRTLEDTFEVQSDIADSVTRALGVVMDDDQREQMVGAGVRDVEAFIAYQKGRSVFFAAHSNELDMDMMAEAADWFTRAIQREPRFASAYFLRSDFYAHRTTMDGVSDDVREDAYEKYVNDLALASEFTRSPEERANIEVDRTLVSTNWRSLPERLETALGSRTCVEGVWLEVAPVFGYAEQSLAFTKCRIERDPLNFYNYASGATEALWLGRPREALELVQAGLAVAPDEPFLEGMMVAALIAMRRVDEAREHAESLNLWNRDILLVTTAVAMGNFDEAKALVPKVLADAGPWNRAYLAIQLNAITGNREAANEAAARMDRVPAGPLMLAATVRECMCGAPFDLEATPNFRQRLEEAGVAWPPPTVIESPVTRLE